MRMTMQDNIDILRRSRRRNVLQPEPQSFARKIDNERPLISRIAVTANDRDLWADRAQLIENGFGANIAEVPDFVRAARSPQRVRPVADQIDHARRQFVMRVG